jgi:hypothetical protein
VENNAMTRMHTYTLVLSLALAAVASIPALAQPDDMPMGRGRKRIEELRRIKMIDALQLNEEQAVRLFAREKDLLQAERSLVTQREACIERLSTLASGGSDGDITTEVDRVAAISREMLTKRQDYLTSLRDILSAQQIARLIVFEHEFRKELRELMQQARSRPRR